MQSKQCASLRWYATKKCGMKDILPRCTKVSNDAAVELCLSCSILASQDTGRAECSYGEDEYSLGTFDCHSAVSGRQALMAEENLVQSGNQGSCSGLQAHKILRLGSAAVQIMHTMHQVTAYRRGEISLDQLIHCIIHAMMHSCAKVNLVNVPYKVHLVHCLP